jgi:alpha-1,3-rhamnosyltransferase
MESPETEQRSDVFAVVPSYNHAPFIEQCLRSIIAQTSPPKKLLVIDDGSTDGSIEIIEKVLEGCPFNSELIARENRGLCATLNEAFALSNDTYFAYLGSDDLWLPDFLAKQTRLLNDRPRAVLAFSHAYVIDENDRITDTTNEWTEFADGDMQPLLLRGVVFSSPGVLYRRDALSRFRWNEDARLEDYEMYLKLSTVGEFARNTNILCAWRRHGVNASTNLPEMFPEMIAAQDRVAPSLRIAPDALRAAQRQMKFAAAANFLRHGFRRQAARLFLENLRGATSVAQIASTAFRLALPKSLFEWNRRRKLETAAGRFGNLDAVMKARADSR